MLGKGGISVSQTSIFYLCIPYIGNISRRVILAKMTFRNCVKFSRSLIFAIYRAINGDL